jgi:cytochrome P450
VICELLGVPYADRAGFHERSVTRFDGTRPDAVRAAAVDASLDYMARLVARQRKEPGEGLLGTLVREYGEGIEDRELTGIGDLLLLGGHETTANVLALGSLLLLQNPEHHDALTDPSGWPGSSRKCCATCCVVQTGVPRVARCDTVLAGRRIRRGERLLCSLPSGNRDEAFTPAPEEFDPTRRATGHLAFGHGIHYCLGAPLARWNCAPPFPPCSAASRRCGSGRRWPHCGSGPGPPVYGISALPVTW